MAAAANTRCIMGCCDAMGAWALNEVKSTDSVLFSFSTVGRIKSVDMIFHLLPLITPFAL